MTHCKENVSLSLDGESEFYENIFFIVFREVRIFTIFEKKVPLLSDLLYLMKKAKEFKIVKVEISYFFYLEIVTFSTKL